MLLSALVSGVTIFAGIIFFHAGYSKIRHSAEYVDIMATYLGRPIRGAAVTAAGVCEMALAVMVLVPGVRWIGALGCSLLLTVYAVLMWRQIQAGRRDMRCGCSGPAAETRIGPELIFRNAVIAIPLFAVAFSQASLIPWVGMTLGLGFSFFLVLIYLSTDQIIANRQRLIGWSA